MPAGENISGHFNYGLYSLLSVLEFLQKRNGDMRNNKPPAMRVESKRYTKNHLSAYNRGVQATIKRKER